MLSLWIVVHQSVALSYLEVDTILLSPVARNSLVGFLVIFKSKDILIVLELLVGLGCNAVLSFDRTGKKNGYNE